LPQHSAAASICRRFKCLEDLTKANAAVAQAVARGRISALEGAELSRILVNQRALFDEDFDRRLRVLEQRESKQA
jgi:hypothetical protein